MRKMPKTSLAIQKKKCCHRLRVTAILTELGYLKKVNTDKMQHSDKISFPRWAIFLWCYIVYTFLYNTNTSTFHVKSLCLKDKCCLGGNMNSNTCYCWQCATNLAKVFAKPIWPSILQKHLTRWGTQTFPNPK